MNRPVHFEILANEPKKMAAFYQQALGWKITTWQGPQQYWLVNTGEGGCPGINGGIHGARVPARRDQHHRSLFSRLNPGQGRGCWGQEDAGATRDSRGRPARVLRRSGGQPLRTVAADGGMRIETTNEERVR
jgi:hypothetical protein